MDCRIFMTRNELISNKQKCWPNIWSLFFPTVFPAFLARSGPKHSTSVPSSLGDAVPLSVDEKEVVFVPNPDPVATVKGLPDPQGRGPSIVVCVREHSLLPPPTLQMVSPLLSPVTLHLKVKASPGQVGGAAVNCPVTPPWKINTLYKLQLFSYKSDVLIDKYSICTTPKMRPCW